ncbi:MAG: hypothetical protein H8D45_12845, partial [Bacteroidetes bacterium]|nr:hypothetical protein [Bacteroidota bacterium]
MTRIPRKLKKELKKEALRAEDLKDASNNKESVETTQKKATKEKAVLEKPKAAPKTTK